MIGFKKNVIEKIWFENNFKRYDLKTIWKDMILKINDLPNKKRYESNIKPSSTEKAKNVQSNH